MSIVILGVIVLRAITSLDRHLFRITMKIFLGDDGA